MTEVKKIIYNNDDCDISQIFFTMRQQSTLLNKINEGSLI